MARNGMLKIVKPWPITEAATYKLRPQTRAFNIAMPAIRSATASTKPEPKVAHTGRRNLAIISIESGLCKVNGM